MLTGPYGSYEERMFVCAATKSYAVVSPRSGFPGLPKQCSVVLLIGIVCFQPSFYEFDTPPRCTDLAPPPIIRRGMFGSSAPARRMATQRKKAGPPPDGRPGSDASALCLYFGPRRRTLRRGQQGKKSMQPRLTLQHTYPVINSLDCATCSLRLWLG